MGNTESSSGPESGLDSDAFDQELRNAAALLDADLELPRSFFLAVEYGNGTDYVHAHVEGGSMNDKVYDLFSPLAVHIEQVAEAANADPEMVTSCALDVLSEMNVEVDGEADVSPEPAD